MPYRYVYVDTVCLALYTTGTAVAATYLWVGLIITCILY